MYKSSSGSISSPRRRKLAHYLKTFTMPDRIWLKDGLKCDSDSERKKDAVLNEQITLFKYFPLMVPTKNFSEYNGFFFTANKKEQMYLHVSLPNSPSLSEMDIINCSMEVFIFIKKHEKELEEWKASSHTFCEFLKWLQSQVVPCHISHLAELPQIHQWKKVYDDLKIIGFDKVESVEPENLNWVKLKITDSASRDHTLKVMLGYSSEPEFEANLPFMAARRVETVSKDIVQVFELFKCEIPKLQLFWNIIDEIDEKCNVKNPESLKPADTHRSIAVDSDVSIMFNIRDPYNPLAQPDIVIIGEENKTGPLKQIAAKLVWPEEGTSFLEKLENAFQMSFSSAKTKCEEMSSSQLSESEMCCICLLPDGLDKSCDKCQSVFHVLCIQKWLQTFPLPSCESFNTIAGKCPVCQEVIWSNLPSG